MHNAKDDAPPVPFLLKSVKQPKQHAQDGAPPVRFQMKLGLVQVQNVKSVAPVPFRTKLVLL